MKNNLDLYEPIHLKCEFSSRDSGLFSFGRPQAVCILSQRIIISDYDNEAILVFDNNGKFIKGISPKTQSNELYHPYGLGTLGKSLLIADPINKGIHILDEEYHLVSSIYIDGFSPHQVCSNSKGLIIVGTYESVVLIVDQKGHIIKKIDTKFNSIGGICCNSKDEILVSDHSNHRIVLLGRNGEFLSILNLQRDGIRPYSWPNGVAVDWQDNIVVMDAWNGRGHIFTPSGSLIQQFRIPGGSSISISKDEMVIVNYGVDLIHVFNRNQCI